MARPRRRRLFLVVALVLLVALAGGAAYVLKVGRSRTDPFGRAVAVAKSGDAAAAEATLRSLLADDPKHVPARSLLIETLAKAKRFDEAERLARYFLDSPGTEAAGLRTLSELAFRKADLDGAGRYARLVAERDPAFSQAMLAQVQEARGTPADREASVRAAETLGLLAKSFDVRASAFLYAAETLRDVEESVPDGPRKAAIGARRDRDRLEAWNAAMKRHDPNLRLPKEALAEESVRTARIQLLSRDPADQRQGVERLEGILSSAPDEHVARAALILHAVSQNDLDKAVALAKEWRDAPPLPMFRAASALFRAKERIAALRLVEGATALPPQVRDPLRAQILLAGDAAEAEEGLKTLERLAKETSSDAALVLQCFSRVREAGDAKRAQRLLDDAAALNPKLRVLALAEKAAAALEAGRDDAPSGLPELAAAAGTSDLLAVALRLQRIPKKGDDAALTFLSAALAAGKVDAREARLLRASFSLVRSGATSDGRTGAEVSRDDLAAVLSDPGVSVSALVRAATLSRGADAQELLGKILGRVLSDPAEGRSAFALFFQAVGDTDPARRDLVARGLRAAAASAAQSETWLGALADAVGKGSAKSLRRRSADGKPADARPQPTEVNLQFAIAASEADWPEAEAFAREVLAAAPDAVESKERLGAVLLDAKKFDDVLALFSSPSPPPGQRFLRIEALRRLGKTAEALAEARLLVKETEGSDRSLVELARVVRESDPDAALATLASAAGDPQADLLRADLLQQRGSEDAAVQVYEDMLRASGNRSVPAWRGLSAIRAAQERDKEFVERMTAAMESAGRGIPVADALQMLLLRGQAYERMRAYEPALADYRKVLKVNPREVVALNNAAWLMGAGLVQRTGDAAGWNEQALSLADRAIAAAPGGPAVHHTRAKILAALERTDDALASFDRALELKGAELERAKAAGAKGLSADLERARFARYLLDKAALLEKKGDIENAKAAYRRVRDDRAGTFEGDLAVKALARLEG